MKWDQNNPEKVKDFIAKMKQDYAFKKAYAARRAWEFYNHPDVAGMCYVAVGGLDSITLFLFLRSIGIEVPGTSVSMLEDRSIQKVHKALGIRALRPANGPKDRPYTKIEVIREHGFPVLSKEIAGKISLLQHPSEKNATVRHAIMTGETGAYGGYRKNTRMKMSQKWLEKFGGPENEKYGTNYQTAPFKVSDLCCYYLKEKPCNDYARSSRRFPYMGLMASEGGRRQKALMLNGCNYISKDTKRSAPFAIFTRQDILTLALEMEEYYQEHWQEFKPITGENEDGSLLYGDPIHLETIVPEIYGEIVRDPLEMTEQEIDAYKAEHNGAEPEGQLRTTKAQRTGCSMCGFGVHIESRPHRFDRLRYTSPGEWEMWMKHICQDENGEWYGWGRVLDYIGVGWEDDLFDDTAPNSCARIAWPDWEKTSPWSSRRKPATKSQRKELAGVAGENAAYRNITPPRRNRQNESLRRSRGYHTHEARSQRGHDRGAGGFRKPVKHARSGAPGVCKNGERTERDRRIVKLPSGRGVFHLWRQRGRQLGHSCSEVWRRRRGGLRL